MHSAGPLPHVELTGAQWRLLARLAEGPVPDPGDRSAFTSALAVDGLDADRARDDLPTLTWMKLVRQAEGELALTDLGAAVHFRALYEASLERLQEVVRLADARQAAAPRFARAVRGLADGSSSLQEAMAATDEVS